MRVLFVCTGNQCRSPMAKGLFRVHAGALGWDVRVASAGFMPAGNPAPDRAIEVMKARGIDISGHRSRALSTELIQAADLVVAMTRQQLIEVASMAPDAWERCFTLVDVVRRGELIGGRHPKEELATWVAGVHGQRRRSSLLSLDLDDDIEDPMGGRLGVFERVAAQIDDLVDRLAVLSCPVGPEPVTGG